MSIGTTDNIEYKLCLDKHEKKRIYFKKQVRIVTKYFSSKQRSLKLKTTNAKSMNLNWIPIWKNISYEKQFLGTAGEI